MRKKSTIKVKQLNYFSKIDFQLFKLSQVLEEMLSTSQQRLQKAKMNPSVLFKIF